MIVRGCLVLVVLLALICLVVFQLQTSGSFLENTVTQLALIDRTTTAATALWSSPSSPSSSSTLSLLLSPAAVVSHPHENDPMHLRGGFDEFRTETISPAVWTLMRQTYNIKSIIDVGCGRGWTSLWFVLHQADAVLCIEASRKALRETVLRETVLRTSQQRHQHDNTNHTNHSTHHRSLHNSFLVPHDYTLGPWWPSRTYDAVWAADFVHQVSLQHQPNYIATFRQAALIFLTTMTTTTTTTTTTQTATTPGWHAVELHSSDWWIRRMELYGFHYDDKLTQQVRTVAAQESASQHHNRPTNLNHLPYHATSIATSLLVFFNPAVASLPQHLHLFSEFGCFHGWNKSSHQMMTRECGGTENDHSASQESQLASHLYPYSASTAEILDMDRAWEQAVRKQVPKNHSLFRMERVKKSRKDKLTAAKAALPALENHAVNKIKQELAKGNTTSLPIIPVVVWPYFEFGPDTAEALHIEENGILESHYLTLSKDIYNFDPNVVWVGDTGYPFQWTIWCERFTDHIKAAKRKRAKLGLPQQWPIYIVDFTDGWSRQRCHNVEAEVGTDFVQYSKRSLVIDRWFVEKEKWVKSGEIIPLEYDGKYYRHTPLIVRTDTIENLQQVLFGRGMKLRDPIEEIDRPVDVTHMWPLDTKSVGTVFSSLRTTVSRFLDKLGNETDLNVFVGLAGDPVTLGRRGVKTAFIDAMLRTKILVVTQRDNWEDFYRLFEALISGALVFVDKMLAKPAGIEDGKALVEFTSLDDLHKKIKYYLQHKEERLAIAKRGRFVSMQRHRTWHRIEEIIFGEALTQCSSNPDCPYIVHANESRRERR